MTTCEKIKRVAKVVYPSSMNPGCFDISPPVRVVQIETGVNASAYLIDPGRECVRLVGRDGFYPTSKFVISERQGRTPIEEITDALIVELEEFLNRVTDEREQDDDGLGSMPTHNARLARNLLDKFGLQRRK